MNLIEARKRGHEGFVRSETRTGNTWIQIVHRSDLTADLDATDWEPKPWPLEPWQGELWVRSGDAYEARYIEDDDGWIKQGWRKIMAREVTE